MNEQALFSFMDEGSEIIPYNGPVNIEQSIDDIKAILKAPRYTAHMVGLKINVQNVKK